MAKHDKYDVEASASADQYVFISVGTRGKVEKRVQFTEVDIYENTYNCAFGDWDEDNECIDDTSVTDNGDRDKVIATVVSTIYDYTSIAPDRFVYFKGSSPVRTRLYNKIISDYYYEFVEDFHIFGIKDVLRDDLISLEPFDYSIDERHEYRAFMVKRRNLEH